MDDLMNLALLEAMKKSDVDAVCKLLCQGADIFKLYLMDDDDLDVFETNEYTFHLGSWSKLSPDIKQKRKEIIKLILESKNCFDYGMIEYVYQSQDTEFAREYVTYIIDHNCEVEKEELLKDIFYNLVIQRSRHGPLELEILKLLLSCGLPIEDFIDNTDFIGDKDSYTPLQCCVWSCTLSFVDLLLEHGANMHRTTKLGRSCLWLASYVDCEDMVELLIKRGAKINEKSMYEESALHRACNCMNPHCVEVFFEHGADVNVLNMYDDPPLRYAWKPKIQEILVREFAIWRLESRTICDENLELLEELSLTRVFKECLEELKIMKGVKFYGRISLYDIILMRRCRKKMTRLVKNKNFVDAFTFAWDRDAFKHYAWDLDKLFVEAEERRNKLRAEEKKLFLIFGEILPEVVVRKVAFHVKCLGLFFE